MTALTPQLISGLLIFEFKELQSTKPSNTPIYIFNEVSIIKCSGDHADKVSPHLQVIPTKPSEFSVHEIYNII